MRGFNEYPRMLFKVDEDGTELTCSVTDAAEKAAKLAEGWQTRYLAWCDGSLPEPEPAPEPKPKGRKAAAAE